MLSVSRLNSCYDSSYNFSLLHCNIRSINKNINSLQVMLGALIFKYDIIALIETWLKPGESVNMPGYKVVCRSRPTKTIGRGVLLFIRDNCNFKLCASLNSLLPSEHDMLFVELSNGTTVGVVYRSPSSKINSFVDKLENVPHNISTSKRKAVLCGDMNIDLFGKRSIAYKTMFESYGFTNTIKLATRVSDTSSTLIDHILCNFDTSSSFSGVIQTDITDHYPIFIFTPSDHKRAKSPYLPMTSVDDQSLRDSLCATSSDIINGTDVNHMYGCLLNAVTKCMKTTHFRQRKNYEQPMHPWVSASALALLSTKDYWYRKHEENKGNIYYRNQYKILRNKVVAALRRSKKQYYNRMILCNQKNPRKLWEVINSVIKEKSNTRNLPDIALYGSSPINLANCFNEYFRNIGRNLALRPPPLTSLRLPAPTANSFAFIDITAAEISSTIYSFCTGKAAGYDNVTVKMLKSNAEVLSTYVEKIFNAAFYAGVYPHLLKKLK